MKLTKHIPEIVVGFAIILIILCPVSVILELVWIGSALEKKEFALEKEERLVDTTAVTDRYIIFSCISEHNVGGQKFTELQEDLMLDYENSDVKVIRSETPRLLTYKKEVVGPLWGFPGWRYRYEFYATKEMVD